jgi:hypothetical protein
MFSYLEPIYSQAVYIRASSALNFQEPGTAGVWPDAISLESRSIVVKETLSSAPSIWDYELAQSYKELGDALGELKELPQDDDWNIEPAVYNAASYIAAELLSHSYPAPQVFTHGPKSVVFNWSYGSDDLYLTISADGMSALISSPQHIQRRIDYAANQLPNYSFGLFAVGVVSWGKPIRQLPTGTLIDLAGLTV